jgi:hypothetical protein
MRTVTRFAIALAFAFTLVGAASAAPASADVPTIGSCFTIGPGGVQGSWGAGWHNGGVACVD